MSGITQNYDSSLLVHDREIESLFSRASQPRLQYGQAAWLDPDEGDSHSRVGPRIGHPPMGEELPSTTRHFQYDFRALRERTHCFYEAAEQGQVRSMP